MATPTPEGLGDKALALWSGITDQYDLRPDELRLLEDACREVDVVERLEAELATDTLTVAGSQGQPVANPLLQEIRQHRGIIARLLAGLKLTDDGSGTGERSAAARSAATARWSSGA